MYTDICYTQSGDIMKTCYIVAAGDANDINIEKEENDIIIACDAGLEHCRNNRINPDYVIGDFDSLGFIPQNNNVIILPVEKDDTDTSYAVKYAMENGFTRFVIFCGTGGKRPEHTYANIALLGFISKNCGEAFLVDKSCVITAITDSVIHFDENMSGDISVFSFDTRSCGITEKGLKYSLDNVTLNNTDIIGVSNSFIGMKSSVSVEKGTLIIYFSGKISDITIDKLN